MSDVLIIGSGPSAMIAAWAAERATGFKPDIMAPGDRSTITGAQYLHEPIPGMPDTIREQSVMFVKRGSEAGYAEKVYGDPEHPSSWQRFDTGMRPMWSMVAVYDWLWRRYSERIIGRSVRPAELDVMAARWDYVISTAPAAAMCRNEEHVFRSQPIWLSSMATQPSGNLVVYNGEPDDDWYRWSHINGVETFEFAKRPRGLFSGGKYVKEGFKPTYTDCDCNPQVFRVGRFAQWKPGVLTHSAYADAMAFISGALEGIG